MGWSPRALLGPTSWPHSSASDPVPQLLWPSPGVLNCAYHFSPRRRPIVHFPTNCSGLLSDELLTIRWFGPCGPSRQREWSVTMVIAGRRWAPIRRNDPWASQVGHHHLSHFAVPYLRTHRPLTHMGVCTFPPMLCADFIFSSLQVFFSLNLEYRHCCEWPIFPFLILFSSSF